MSRFKIFQNLRCFRRVDNLPIRSLDKVWQPSCLIKKKNKILSLVETTPFIISANFGHNWLSIGQNVFPHRVSMATLRGRNHPLSHLMHTKSTVYVEGIVGHQTYSFIHWHLLISEEIVFKNCKKVKQGNNFDIGQRFYHIIRDHLVAQYFTPVRICLN